jgi:hypothetical protein
MKKLYLKKLKWTLLIFPQNRKGEDEEDPSSQKEDGEMGLQKRLSVTLRSYMLNILEYR